MSDEIGIPGNGSDDRDLESEIRCQSSERAGRAGNADGNEGVGLDDFAGGTNAIPDEVESQSDRDCPVAMAKKSITGVSNLL